MKTPYENQETLLHDGRRPRTFFGKLTGPLSSSVRATIAGVVLLAAGGCEIGQPAVRDGDQADGGSARAAPETPCVKGESSLCGCTDGRRGARECLEDQSGFGECVCTGDQEERDAYIAAQRDGNAPDATASSTDAAPVPDGFVQLPDAAGVSADAELPEQCRADDEFEPVCNRPRAVEQMCPRISDCNAALEEGDEEIFERQDEVRNYYEYARDFFCHEASSQTIDRMYRRREGGGGFSILNKFSISGHAGSEDFEERIREWQESDCEDEINALEQQEVVSLLTIINNPRPGLDSFNQCVRDVAGVILACLEQANPNRAAAAWAVPDDVSPSQPFGLHFQWCGGSGDFQTQCATVVQFELSGARCEGLENEDDSDGGALRVGTVLPIGELAFDCDRDDSGRAMVALLTLAAGGQNFTASVYLPRTCGGMSLPSCDGRCDNALVEDLGTGYCCPRWVESPVQYVDRDDDGYGKPGTRVIECQQLEGYADNDYDCDDRFAHVHPGGEERECDGLDDNCDGNADEDLLNSCGECAPEPSEVCDDRDNDCDGENNEGGNNLCPRNGDCCTLEGCEPRSANEPLSACFTHDQPARSCREILQTNPDADTGLYSLRPVNQTYQVWCNMEMGGAARAARLDGRSPYCIGDPDDGINLMNNPMLQGGKLPDEQTQAIAGAPGAVGEIIYDVQGVGWIRHDLLMASHFNTASRDGHRDEFYCHNWRCPDGSAASTTCGDEGSGCPIIGRGSAHDSPKVYVDGREHPFYFHTGGGLCGMDNRRPGYTPVDIYVR